jgi:hypothetical protein
LQSGLLAAAVSIGGLGCTTAPASTSSAATSGRAVGASPDQSATDQASPDQSAADHEHQHASTANGQPDAVIAGPQGVVPQFAVNCGFSHAAPDDPIVHPGDPGASHLHVFFGNTTTDAFSTLGSLLGQPTTCEQTLDTATYWAPALLREGAVIEPSGATAYYRPGLAVDPTSLRPYPPGLAMIAGDAGARGEQPLEVVAWGCGTGSVRSVTPPVCPVDGGLRMFVTFPDCWDGERLDSDDHVSHVAYSSAGACPDTHPVAMPQLQLSVHYDTVSGPAEDLRLASGSLLTGHADFLNSWDQARLEREVAACLHRQLTCGLGS